VTSLPLVYRTHMVRLCYKNINTPIERFTILITTQITCYNIKQKLHGMTTPSKIIILLSQKYWGIRCISTPEPTYNGETGLLTDDITGDSVTSEGSLVSDDMISDVTVRCVRRSSQCGELDAMGITLWRFGGLSAGSKLAFEDSLLLLLTLWHPLLPMSTAWSILCQTS